MAANPIFISNLKNGVVTIVNADGTSLKTLLTAGSAGSRVKSLSITSDDSVDRVVQLWLTTGATDYLLGEATIVDGAGSNGTDKSYNLLNAADLPFLQSDGANRFLDLAASAVLKLKSKTAVTAAKTLYAFAEYGDI